MVIEFLVLNGIAYPVLGRGKSCTFRLNGKSVRVKSNFEEVFFGDPEKCRFIPCWQTCVIGHCPARKKAADVYYHLKESAKSGT